MGFGIGFLAASLLIVIVVPFVHERAVRLTTQKVLDATPVSLVEVQAGKDLLRAEFAMSMYRMETRLAAMRTKAAAELAEIGRQAAEIGRLKTELGKQSSRPRPLWRASRCASRPPGKSYRCWGCLLAPTVAGRDCWRGNAWDCRASRPHRCRISRAMSGRLSLNLAGRCWSPARRTRGVASAGQPWRSRPAGRSRCRAQADDGCDCDVPVVPAVAELAITPLRSDYGSDAARTDGLSSTSGRRDKTTR